MTADRIGSLLARAHGVVRHRMTNALEGSGLHLGHVAILSLLANGEGRTQKALSAETGIEKSSMVLFLDALEKEGWVERRPHPGDRRAYLVTLTAKGAKGLSEVGPRLGKAQVEAFGVLTADEQSQLAVMLRKLIG